MGPFSDEIKLVEEVIGIVLNEFGSLLDKEERNNPDADADDELRNAFEGVNAVEETELFLVLIGSEHLTEL